MRVWLARVFIGLAFSLLLAHNLMSHHHDEEAIESGIGYHDHNDDHSDTPFDNLKVDGNYVQKLDFQHTDISVPINLIVVQYSFILQPLPLVQEYSTLPPEYPPSLVDIDTSSLRGPPVYC